MRRQSPTVNRRRLARTLRRLREQAHLQATDAARQVDHDQSWLSRIESAEVRPHPNDVRALLTLYGLPQEEAEAVIAIARLAKQRGWWQRYSDVLPDWFATYVGMESEASLIRNYECQAVPGLMQTEDYARAIFRGAPTPLDEPQVERQVALRLDRQALLDADDPPQLRMVLDEGAVRRLIGGRKVMGAQIRRLLELSERQHIEIQLLPFDTGAGYDGSFFILDFPAIPAPYPFSTNDQMVYVGTLAGAMYLDRPHEIEAYTAAHEQLRALALSPRATRDALRAIADT